MGYDPKGGNEKGLEFAKIKPQVVIGSMKEFTKPQYNVDVLKVEVPVNAEFVEGSAVYKGEKAYTRAEALAYYRQGAEVATKPFIYLSAGVSNDAVRGEPQHGDGSRARIIRACCAAGRPGKRACRSTPPRA